MILARRVWKGRAEMAVQRNGSLDGYPHIEPLEISDDELRKEIAREAQEHLGMTYEEFVEAYQQGDLPDELVANELAMLLRFVEHSSRV